MKHVVDGFELDLPATRSWKAERRQYGRRIDEVPLTWTNGRRDGGGEKVFQEVWFKDRAELERRAADPRPFVVLLATTEDRSVLPHAPKDFVGLFEVAATGRILSGISLETEVRRRVRAY
jgi:hypothetical protein